ncbi:MAG: hypothetical protein QOF49_895, partial [Chloroflexota bacterium]|nr:hypothetical protein [Chloroflexota bacterium]
MNQHLEEATVKQHRPSTFVVIVLAVAALVAACSGGSGPLGTLPASSTAAEPSVVQGSPDVTPAPSGQPTDDPTGDPAGSVAPTAEPSAAPPQTTIVRAYLWLGGLPGSAGLVAVLREVPATKSVATAAITALLAGPTGGEASRSITTAVPDGSRLLGITIADGVATIDLSSEFE